MALIQCGIPRRDVYLVGTFGEEHGLVGARELVAAGIVPSEALAFVGEPSHLQVITANKGLMVFQLEIQFEPYNEAHRSFPLYRLIFEGRSAHSSTPALGLNAIQKAIEALEERPDLHIATINGGDAVNKVPARCEVGIAGEPMRSVANVSRFEDGRISVVEFVPSKVFSQLAMFVGRLSDFANRAGGPEAGYSPPTLTFNLGMIQSSRGSVLVEFELRPPPSLPLDYIRQGIDGMVATLSSLHSSNEIRVTERRANPGFRSSSGSETVELAMAALAASHLPLESGVKAGCTEAGVYATAGIKPVVFGPGPSTGVIHAPNEYNLVFEVQSALHFYRELLRL
jgi:succinyl-diaminopimelate desuccinylase